METDQIYNELEEIRQMMTVSYEGKEYDSSWMRPKIVSPKDKRIYLHTALSYLDKLMEQLKTSKPSKNNNTLGIGDVSNQRELLIAFAEWIFKKTKGLSVIKRMVDRYLSNS